MNATASPFRWAMLLIGLIGLISAGVTLARQPVSLDGAIQACVKTSNGVLRIVGAAADCKANETPLTWNTQGPQGDVGPAGPTGPQGAAGPPGPTPCPFDAPTPPCSAGTGHGFLKIPQVPGASQESRHENEIDVQYVKFGAARASGSQASGSFKVDHVVLGKRADIATEPLFAAAAHNTTYSKVVLTLRRDAAAGGVDFLKYELDGVHIVGTHTTWKGGDPVEEIELSFTKVKSTYSGPGGNKDTCWQQNQHPC